MMSERDFRAFEFTFADHYVLVQDPGDEHPRPAPVRTMGEFVDGRHHESVAVTRVGLVVVSTVFLGLDHNFRRLGVLRGWLRSVGDDDGDEVDLEPHVFETMVFGGHHDQHQARCGTWARALEQHARCVSMVRDTTPQVLLFLDNVAPWFLDAVVRSAARARFLRMRASARARVALRAMRVWNGWPGRRRS